jgi:hypothetical protein
MFMTKSKTKYIEMLELARGKLAGKTDLLQKLDAIASDPNRYAGYVLAQREGNLGITFSQSAESENNKKSRMLGDGATWSAAHHTEEMVNMRKGDQRKIVERIAKYTVDIRTYKSKLIDKPSKLDDEEAYTKLSREGYKLFFKHCRKSAYFQYEWNEEETKHVFTKHHKSGDVHYKVKFGLGERCPCFDRIKWRAQCEHELGIQGDDGRRFNIDKWATRWYNDPHFDSLYALKAQSMPPNTPARAPELNDLNAELNTGVRPSPLHGGPEEPKRWTGRALLWGSSP